MIKKIIIVEDVFWISGRGLVVTGWQDNTMQEAKINDFIEVIKPDGTSVNSQITGIENFRHHNCFGENHRRNVAFSLQNLSKSDVPRGSVINLLS
jgi:translation elongation factor EF-Tu-like GTPase